MDADVIILGGGPAGCRAAVLLAESGKKVLLVEKDRIGGRCLHKACIPTKAFASATSRPDFSWRVFRREVAESIRGMQEGQSLILRSRGVKILRGEGRLRADGSVCVKPTHADCSGSDGNDAGSETGSDARDDSMTLTADHVILACGSVPIIPEELREWVRGSAFLTTESFWDLEELPERMTVVGAGPAGCELACGLAKAGVRVTLTEQASSILPGWPAGMQDELRDALTDLGVAVREHCETVSAPEELVLLAAGRTADRAALEGTGDDGLEDSQLYVIGDMSARQLTADHAIRQAEQTAGLILDGRVRTGPEPVPVFCVFTDPPLAKAGLSEEEARERGFSAVSGTAPYYAVPAAVLEGARSGYIKVVRDKETDRLLGAEIVGMHAVELIHVLGPALNGKITAEALLRQTFFHPSYAEGIQIAVEESRGGSPGLPKRRRRS